MDVLKIFTESSDQLVADELDILKAELAMGEGYSQEYISRCLAIIKNMKSSKKKMAGAAPSGGERPLKNGGNGIVKRLSEILPDAASDICAGDGDNCDDIGSGEESFVQSARVADDIAFMRGQSDHKQLFKKYIRENEFINAEFADKNFSLFNKWEINAVISIRQMGEEFLEKYFNMLDSDKIARYQLFSEKFFMKHFDSMDADIVMKRGKNPWRRKDDMSKQLEVFLRLKGVEL